MQPSGAVPLSHTQYRNTRQNNISLLWPEKGNNEFILEFSGLYHYQLREGRKPKYSEKTPDDLFIVPVIVPCHLQGENIVSTAIARSVTFLAGVFLS
jgi:hypothetical protein